MLKTFKITSKLSSRFLISKLFSPILLHQKPNLNPFIPSSSPLHTSNQYFLQVSDLDFAFESISNLDEAVALFYYMLQMKQGPSIHHYSKLFAAIVKLDNCSNVEKMEHNLRVILMFKELVSLGHPVNEYIMSSVVNCYAHIKEIELGFGIVGFFLKRGYVANIFTINCLIKGLFLKGRLVEAIDLFKDLVNGGLYEANEMNEYTIPIVLNGLAKSGYIANAVELLKISEKKDWKIDVVSYNTVIDGHCRVGMLKEGRDLILRMVDKDILPNVVTYNCFIHGLCMNGQLDFARNVFNDLPSKGICPDVIAYTVMIQGFCREGLFKDAKEMLDEMDRVGNNPDSVTYNIIFKNCLHNRNRVDSIELLKHIVGRDFQLDGPSFFVSLRNIQELRQMKGVYDDEVVNQLMRKLISSCGMHQMQDKDDGLVISSLMHKLRFGDRNSSV